MLFTLPSALLPSKLIRNHAHILHFPLFSFSVFHIFFPQKARQASPFPAMVDLTDIHEMYPPKPNHSLTSDGSEMFPYLWRYFLSHQPLRDWLMRSAPYTTVAVSPRHVSQGIAFCCNFSVPNLWSDMADSFGLGEMFIPDHAYSHFMCGTVVAATSFHKHLICALGSAANRQASSLPSYRTCVRRMVVDMGSSRSINIMEFSWMEDGALVVTTKVLVPPDPSLPFQSAGCTGAFALFTDVSPGGPAPTVPRSLVSFMEAPLCPFCSAAGSLGCYCSNSMPNRYDEQNEAYSSAIFPPRLEKDLQGTAIDTYHNIRSRLDLIQHISHVKITAHVVTPLEFRTPSGLPSKTYSLGPSRFVVKAVLFRPSNGFEADTLRQVADKLRLLRIGTLNIASAFQKQRQSTSFNRSEDGADIDNDITSLSFDMPKDSSADFHIPTIPSPTNSAHDTTLRSVFSSVSSHVTNACRSCGKALENSKIQCQTCSTYASEMTSINVSHSKPSHVKEVVSGVVETPSTSGSPSKRLKCPLCEKTFSQQGSLNRHLKNIHEERKIPCQFCSMMFGQMFDLKVSSLFPWGLLINF